MREIFGEKYTIGHIFSSKFDFIIPHYQRPYSWEQKHVSALFEDLFSAYEESKSDNGKIYFLGSIVVAKKEENPRAEVIDGQQRLTTLTILFALIAHKFPPEERGEVEDLFKERGKILAKILPKPRLALRNRDQAFFNDYVQNVKFDDLFNLSKYGLSDPQKAIKGNSVLLRDKISEKFGSDKEKLGDFYRFLIDKCFMFVVSTPDAGSAFQVFSILNNRGMDLQTTDIIKAEIVGNLEESKEKELSDKWEELEDEIGRENFEELFSHIRMIHIKQKPKKSLFEDYKEIILKNENSEQFVANTLVPFAEAYQKLTTQLYASSPNADKVNNLLKWLNKIDNFDWIPPAMLYLCRHKPKEENKEEQVVNFFKKIERLAAYMYICRFNVNQRIERYAKVMHEMEKDSLAPLEFGDNEKSDLMGVLNGNVYEENNSKLRNYIILRLDSFMSDGVASYDYKTLTIEHVLPQTIGKDSEWLQNWEDATIREQWLHKIANLVPLSRRKNSAAQNYGFKEKKEKYFTSKSGVSAYVLTTNVLSKDDWTPEIVEERQKELLGFIKRAWEL